MLLLSGCVNDEVIEPDSPTTKSEISSFTLPGYLSVKLIPNESTGTRANPFNDGDDPEFALATPKDDEQYHYLLIYDEDNKNSTPVVLPLDVTDVKKDTDPSDNLTLTVKDAYSLSEIPVELKDEDALKTWLAGKKAYVLLNFSKFILNDNINSTIDVLGKISREEFESLQLKDYKITLDGKDYFVMSNSVYMASSQKKIDGEIFQERVYETKEEAKEKDPTIELHVERLAVKYSVAFNPAILIGNTSDDEPEQLSSDVLYRVNTNSSVKLFEPRNGEYLIIGAESYEIPSVDKGWEVEVLGYGMNALEPSSYLFKDIEEINQQSWTWNSTDDRRCYWARDPHYSITDEIKKYYPDQFRQSLEMTNTVRNLHAGEYKSDGLIDVNSIKEKYLTYKPYNDFENHSGTLYTLENTYDDHEGLLGERGFYSAGTHLILAGRIKINDIAAESDLYYDQNSIFYTNEKDLFTAKLEILNKIILKNGVHGLRVLNVDWLGHTPSTNNVKLLSWNEGSVLWITKNNQTIKATADDFRFIPAELAGGDGSVLIAPRSEITNIYLAPEDENGNIDDHNKKEITANDLISLIHKQIGAIDHFKDGKVYYAAMIQNKFGELTEDSYKTPGDYGCVRNNWYDITVNGIVGVGRPVDDSEQPIIPTEEVKRSYLNITVNILDWHRIPQYLEEGDL